MTRCSGWRRSIARACWWPVFRLFAPPGFPRLRAIADSVGAWLFVDIAHVAGLVAAGLYPNPVPYADIVTTTTHKTLRGPRGGLIMGRANPDIEKKIASMVFPGIQGGPLMHVIAAKAVAFKEAQQADFAGYQRQVLANARAMAATFQDRGYKIVSGGTDNHLLLVDLTGKSLTGKDADAALGQAGITVNKNAVPNDPQPPFVTSGIRIGTPAVTSRGFGEAEVRDVADWICDVLDDHQNPAIIATVADEVQALCRRYPCTARPPRTPPESPARGPPPCTPRTPIPLRPTRSA